MTPAKVIIQLNEYVGALDPCVAAALTHGDPQKVQCSGRTWQMVIQVHIAGAMTGRHVPIVCDAHALATAAHQIGEVMQSADLRRAGLAATGWPS